jgi:hypothetical protein
VTSDTRNGTLASVLIAVGGWAILGGPLIWLYQLGMWILHSDWPEVPFAAAWAWTALPFPEPTLETTETILDWIFDQPASMVLPMCGVLILAGARGLPTNEDEYPDAGKRGSRSGRDAGRYSVTHAKKRRIALL